MVIESWSFEIPLSDSLLCHLPVARPQASQFLSLGFLSCEMGLLCLHRPVGGISEVMPIKHCGEGLPCM